MLAWKGGSAVYNRVPTGMENLGNVRNQISYLRPGKGKQLAGKVRKAWEMHQKVRKCREFHAGKDMGNNTKYNLNKSRIFWIILCMLGTSEKIWPIISCKIGRGNVLKSQENVRNFILARTWEPCYKLNWSFSWLTWNMMYHLSMGELVGQGHIARGYWCFLISRDFQIKLT